MYLVGTQGRLFSGLFFLSLLGILSLGGCAGETESSFIPPLQVMTTSLADAVVGDPYSDSVNVSGGVPPYTWSLQSGALPNGLSLNSSTGEIAGTPTTTATSNFTVEVTDTSSPPQSDTQDLSIQVTDPLRITTVNVNDGVVGDPYSDHVDVSGGVSPYTWSLQSGALPNGLSLNSSTGEIAGTPTATGVSNFTAEVADSDSPPQNDTQNLNIEIADPLVITTTSLPDAEEGVAYSATLQASGGIPSYGWNITTGFLPTGLMLDGATGEISGTTSDTGTFNFTVAVTDSAQPSNSDTQALSLKVNPSGTPPPSGVLTVNSTNPRYFDDGTGDAIYLAGIYNQHVLRDQTDTPGGAFSFTDYLNALEADGMNYVRFFNYLGTQIQKNSAKMLDPQVYVRSSICCDNQGDNKFDLSQINTAFIDRYEARVQEANNRGIIVAVQFYQGFSLRNDLSYPAAYYRNVNNINGINADQDSDGDGHESQNYDPAVEGPDAALDAILQLQKDFVETLVNRLNQYDNVIWEIDNESHDWNETGWLEWKEEIASHIRSLEASLPKQHLIYMSSANTNTQNHLLRNSTAEVWSPRDDGDEDFGNDSGVGPPVNDGSKIIVNDGDHIWGRGCGSVGSTTGCEDWAWKSFTRGHHVAVLHPNARSWNCSDSTCDAGRAGEILGHTVIWSKRIDLKNMPPSTTLCSTGFCLVNNGVEYLTFDSDGGSQTVDLSAGSGKNFSVAWFNTVTGAEDSTMPDRAGGSASESFTSPFGTDPVVLYLKAN